MALKKNLALMGVTTGFRLLAGVVTFSMVARLLGPAEFGVLMLWLSVSVLLCLTTNYGLTPYVLREVGRNPASAPGLIANGLSAKLLLSVLLVICVAIGVWVLSVENWPVLALLMAATLADSFSEFLNAGLRASNRFDVETRIATAGAFLHATIVISSVYFFPDVNTAACAYLISRSLILSMTIVGVHYYFSRLRVSRVSDGIGLIRSASIYALDFGFQSLFGQVDSLVLNHFVGPVAVGIHQAGMRIFQGAISGLQVLANVFLPRAAAVTDEKQRFASEALKVQMCFLAYGLIIGLVLGVGSDSIVDVLFGSDFSSLKTLLPIFGILFFVRLSASAWGVLLTASGEQRYRTFATGVHWLIVGAFAYILVPGGSVSGWLYALIIGNAALAVLYAIRCSRERKFPWIVVVATTAGLMMVTTPFLIHVTPFGLY
jgi:O-antigen/teichoic acid export membrane protein